MIPHNINREHILYAFEKIYLDGLPECRSNTKYILVHKGKKYPPKHVISIANVFANDRELDPSAFSEGEETNQYLEKLGFNIIELEYLADIKMDPICLQQDRSINRQKQVPDQVHLRREKKKNQYIDQPIEKRENILPKLAASSGQTGSYSKLITEIKNIFSRYDIKYKHILYDSENESIIVVKLSDKSIWDNTIWPELSNLRSITSQRPLQDVDEESTFSVLISYDPLFSDSINIDEDQSRSEITITNQRQIYDVWLHSLDNNADRRQGQVGNKRPLGPIDEFEDLAEAESENISEEAIGAYPSEQGIKSDYETPDLYVPLIATIVPPSYQEWMVSLPFPLASILSSCFAEKDDSERAVRLFNFFKVFSQFSATLLLSEYVADNNRYRTLSELISYSNNRFGQTFRNPSFASWIILSEWLGKKRREESLDGSDQKFSSKTPGVSTSIFGLLGSKDLSAVLRNVLILKTHWRESGTSYNRNELAQVIKKLMDSLDTIKSIVGNFSTRLELIKTEKKISDQQTKQFVTKLTGVLGPLIKEEISMARVPDESTLYIFPKSISGPHEPFPMLPLFLILEESSPQPVCYEYDGIDDFGVRWVSYHCKQFGQIYTSDRGQNDVIELLQNLTT